MYSLRMTIWPMPQGSWRRGKQAEPSRNAHAWSLSQMLASAPDPMAELPTAFYQFWLPASTAVVAFLRSAFP